MSGNNESDINIFSINKIDAYLGKNLWPIALVTISLLIVIALIGQDKINRFAIIFVVALFFGFTVVCHRIFRNFIQTIEVNHKNNTLKLHLLQAKEPCEISFDGIDSIKVNGYVMIKLKKKVFYYKNLTNEELFSDLSKIAKIEFGTLCTFFGPSKEIRNKNSQQGEST